jgi:hypothetical protein
LEHRGHVLEGGGRAQTLQAQGLAGLNHGGAICAGQGLNQTHHVAAVGTPEHLTHGGFFDTAAAEGDGLVGE